MPTDVRIRPITIVSTETARDPYGNTTRTETRTQVQPYGLAPRQAEENDRYGRAGVIVGYTAYLPPDVAMDADDTVEVDGEVYQVVGQPGRWTNPWSGADIGLQVALTRATG